MSIKEDMYFLILSVIWYARLHNDFFFLCVSFADSAFLQSRSIRDYIRPVPYAPLLVKLFAFPWSVRCTSRFTLVQGFKCWLCRKGPGSVSFEACNKNREEQICAPGLDACGIFSYENKTGHRLHGKSCTYRSWCGKKDVFCKNVIGGGKFCRVQCCYEDLCNYWTKYQVCCCHFSTNKTN